MHAPLSRRSALALASLPAAALLASRGAAQEGGQDQEPLDTLGKLSFPKTIVLVRHAEKGEQPPQDPDLSEKGAARAQRLAELFAPSGVTHLFASEFVRSQQTLAPLAVLAGVNVQVVSARQPEALLSALESTPRGSVAVVSGHSNTVPALLEKLTGGQAKIAMQESEYERLFVVTQWGKGRDARALELRY
jgi:2,3-bisphosphoglycerate-dependent phosphoglycerate mutase